MSVLSVVMLIAMNLGLWKPDDGKDKARLILVSVCRVSSWNLTEMLLKIKSPKTLRGDSFKIYVWFGAGGFLKSKQKAQFT